MIKEKLKTERGITLIALVVTIVVLLILAGITISLVFGSNGVIKKAQDSKEQTEIGEMREKLEMAKVPVYADGNGSYKVQNYWDRIESEGLIADKTVDIIDNGDGTYEVTTTPGYVFEITVEPNKEIAENIIIGECIGKGENLSIGIRIVNKTTNSIEIELVRVEGASNFKYSIKKQGEEYGTAEEKSETRHVFSGLTQGGIYTIKVEATKDGKQQIVEKTVQVGEIPLAIEGDIIWTGNGQAEVRLYTNETGYQIEWQKNGIGEGSWTREASGVKEKTITGLVNGDIIYARLYDGISSGKYANIEVMDNIDPTLIYKLSTEENGVENGVESVVITVTAEDKESGIANITTPDGEQIKTGTTVNITYTATLNGEYKFTARDKAGNVSKELKLIINNIKVEVDREKEGEIDIKFVDKNNKEIEKPNTPKLGNAMTAIKWDSSAKVWKKVEDPMTDTSWYNYTETDKMWANAVLDGTFNADGILDMSATGYSMFVYIPRYAYKITYYGGNGTTIAGYSDIRGIVDQMGNVIEGTKKEGAVEVGDKYVLHPAFEYGEAVDGIWVAKFEASSVEGNSNNDRGDNVTSKTLQVKPGVSSWRHIDIGNMYTVCLNYNSTLNSHMMKNDEWGAVAYLSKSKYGKETEEVWINNSSSFITGSAGNSASADENVGTTTDYTSTQGVKASTTGTVYGVYDMSGGAWEYVAAYVNNGNSSLTSYGSALLNGESKTKNVYSKASSDNRYDNYNRNSGKYGDAVYETSAVDNIKYGLSWYQDYDTFPYENQPFFIRGGDRIQDTGAGVFCFNILAGYGSSNSFRPVLALL